MMPSLPALALGLGPLFGDFFWLLASLLQTIFTRFLICLRTALPLFARLRLRFWSWFQHGPPWHWLKGRENWPFFVWNDGPIGQDLHSIIFFLNSIDLKYSKDGTRFFILNLTNSLIPFHMYPQFLFETRKI